MVALRSRRLESLFGSPFDDLTVSHVRGLTRDPVQEAFDLDFKRGLYGRGDSDKRALAIDVAAMANTAGGVIILGVEEDDQARAVATPGVNVSDNEVGRIRQLVASNVSPHPVLDIVAILDEAEPIGRGDQRVPLTSTGDVLTGHGFLMLAVPRSPNAPHAVLVDNTLRYPKRSGSTTRYLSEPEVAAAYRDRHFGAARQMERISQVETEALERLDRSERPWLLVTVVPDLPGDLVINSSVHKQFQQDVASTPAVVVEPGVRFVRTGVGRRRLLADAGSGQGGRHNVVGVSLELHVDGCGAFALQLVDIAPGAANQGPGLVRQVVSDESVTVAIISGLLCIAEHARDRAAAGGNVLARARLVASTEAYSIEIGQTRSGSGVLGGASGAVGTLSSTWAETVADLEDLAGPGPGLVAVGSVLADEIGQAFGVPELGQLTHDGEVRRPYWSTDRWRGVEQWAEHSGIIVSDSSIP